MESVAEQRGKRLRDERRGFVTPGEIRS